MVSYHHIIPRSGGFQNDEGLQKLSHTCTKCLTLCLWVEMVYKHRLGSSVSTSKMLFAMILRSGGPWRRGNDLSAPPLYAGRGIRNRRGMRLFELNLRFEHSTHWLARRPQVCLARRLIGRSVATVPGMDRYEKLEKIGEGTQACLLSAALF